MVSLRVSGDFPQTEKVENEVLQVIVELLRAGASTSSLALDGSCALRVAAMNGERLSHTRRLPTTEQSRKIEI